MVVGLNAARAQQQAHPFTRRGGPQRVSRRSTAQCACISTGFSRSSFVTSPAPSKPAPTKPLPVAATTAAWPLPQRTTTRQLDGAAQPQVLPDPPATAQPAAIPAAAEPLTRQPSTQLPNDFINEFESRLEADIKTIGSTVGAVTGVICFWRGVWSLLDHVFGDTIEGDVACCVIGLCIIFWIRVSGARIGTFWPSS